MLSRITGLDDLKKSTFIMITDSNAPRPIADDVPQTNDTRQMTFGEKLVGLTFNPSNDDKVSKAKKLCADLADLLYDDQKNSETSELKKVLLPATYAEILNAQMNVVKVLTLKY